MEIPIDWSGPVTDPHGTEGALVEEPVSLIARRPTSISSRWLPQSLAKVDELYRRQGDPICLYVALALVQAEVGDAERTCENSASAASNRASTASRSRVPIPQALHVGNHR